MHFPILCTRAEMDQTPTLYWACRKGYKDVVELLIKHGVRVTAMDDGGITPLMEACQNGYLEIAELLLKQ